MTLTELGISYSLEVPPTIDERRQLALGSEVVCDFLNNPRNVGLIPAEDVIDYIISPEYGEQERELFTNLGFIALRKQQTDRQMVLREGSTDFGDQVYSLIQNPYHGGVLRVSSLIRVGDFIVGHSHKTRRGLGTSLKRGVTPLKTDQVHDFPAYAHRHSRAQSR